LKVISPVKNLTEGGMTMTDLLILGIVLYIISGGVPRILVRIVRVFEFLLYKEIEAQKMEKENN
jgi:hypothetical protein